MASWEGFLDSFTDGTMANFATDILGPAAQAGIGTYGYNYLQDQMSNNRDATNTYLDAAKTDITGYGTFQPWGVSSGLGSTGYDPTTGQMTNTLSGNQQNNVNNMQNRSNSMFASAQQMDPRFNHMYNQGQYNQRTAINRGSQAANASNRAMQNSLQDPSQRESDIYGRMRDMQRPEEQRQYDSMNAGLFGSGRGGMSTEAYGGSPEQFAFGKAQSEARNQASMQAMGQSQTEMMNQANMANQYGSLSNQYGQQAGQFNQLGQSALTAGGNYQNQQNQMGNQMFQNQYMPYSQMQAFGNQGIQQGQITSGANQNVAGLLAQLGIGRSTADINYANAESQNLVGLLRMLGGMGGGT
tara:strand:- start:4329 stop:5393 length:1065 start_codon:yes stop_codon:yes gene_type:complete